MVGVAVQCGRGSPKAILLKGSAQGMEEPSFCNLSLAVDCTLSLGSTTSRTDIPARLSRAGSPDDEDLDWSLSVRSEREDPSLRTNEQDRSGQDLSWGRSDPDLSPEYYPQVSESGAGGGDGGGRRVFKAWPRSSAQSYKDEVNNSKALFSMFEDQTYSKRASRQPWLPNYLSSRVADEKPEQCIEESDSFVRVCAHCGTSKTPLWRNGPGGPKSLCNACGIRFKKAGRRSAASGAAEGLQVSPPTKMVKRKLMHDEPQYWMFPADSKPRKRSRGLLLHRTSESLLSDSCMTWQPWSSSPKSTLHRDFRTSPLSPGEDRKVPALDSGSFSSEEEEGAVLLMALSCGIVNA